MVFPTKGAMCQGAARRAPCFRANGGQKREATAYRWDSVTGDLQVSAREAFVMQVPAQMFSIDG